MARVHRLRVKLILALALSVLVAALVMTFLRHKACGSTCVVLMGDSITANLQGMMPGGDLAEMQIVNRGVPGDDTARMLARFQHDVIRLIPRVVVIQGGINDFERVPLESTKQNLETMAKQAEGNGIRVVLATLPPLGKHDSADAPSAQDFGRQQIRALNEWVRNLAARKHYVLADYHAVLQDEKGSFLDGLTTDGIHPSAKGCERIESVLGDAIRTALRDGY